MSTKDKIEKILRESFRIERLEIQDDSALHAGHAETQKRGGGHFSIKIASPDFDGKSALKRHRMVYSALKKELQSEIHALAIKIQGQTPNW